MTDSTQDIPTSDQILGVRLNHDRVYGHPALDDPTATIAIFDTTDRVAADGKWMLIHWRGVYNTGQVSRHGNQFGHSAYPGVSFSKRSELFVGTLESVQYRVREPVVSPEEAAHELLARLEVEAGERFAEWQATHPLERAGDEGERGHLPAEVQDAIGTIAYAIAENADIEVLAPLALTTFWEHVPEGQPAWFGLQGALRDAVYDSLQTFLEGKAGRVFEAQS